MAEAAVVLPAVAAENKNTSENPIGTDQDDKLDQSADVPQEFVNLDIGS